MLLPESIVNELKSSRPVASPELRERVREIASRPPEPPRPPLLALPSFRLRRFAAIAVPACLALAIASAAAIGLARSGGDETVASQPTKSLPGVGTGGEEGVDRDTALPYTDEPETTGNPSTELKLASPPNLQVDRGRAQLYAVDLSLRVKDVSATSKSVLRLTKDFGGYVRTVDISGTGGGIVVRVPIGSVQRAIVAFSELGTIVAQDVSIQDVQPQIDERFRKMQALRKDIAKLQARLGTQGLSADEREKLAGEIADRQASLRYLQREQAEQRRVTSFATVSLSLRTAKEEVAPPPGRFDRALDNVGAILAREAEIGLYVALVGAPIVALLALLLGAARIQRRRSDERLLAS